MPKKYTDEELVGLIKSSGWALDDKKNPTPIAGTLEDVLKARHQQHQSGEELGLIRRLETSAELDMIQIEKLWRYLGLPV